VARPTVRRTARPARSSARAFGGLPPLQRSDRLPSLPIVTPPAAKSQAQKRRRRGNAAGRRTNAPFGGMPSPAPTLLPGSARASAYLRVCHPLKRKAATVPRLCAVVPTNRPTCGGLPRGERQFHHRSTLTKRQAFRKGQQPRPRGPRTPRSSSRCRCCRIRPGGPPAPGGTDGDLDLGLRGWKIGGWFHQAGVVVAPACVLD
jgi:hypothetical protein